MGKVKEKNLSWTPVPLNEAILASGVEGLVGIEELTNYEIEDNEFTLSKNKRIKSNKATNQLKPKTRKASRPRPNANNRARDQKKSRPLILSKTAEHVGVASDDSCDEDNSISNLEDTEHDEDSSDILSWSSLFAPTPVARALIDLGFCEPTEIQRLAIPPAIKGRRDILGAAETGSGKTLAFGIPIIHGILSNLENESENQEPTDEDSEESDREDMDNEGVGCVRVVNLGKHEGQPSPAGKLWALVLTPTRELAVQIRNHLVAALKYTNIKVAVVVGGMSVQKQQRLLRRGPHIVVATPGRLWELISQGEPHFNNIESIRYLAIDEADRMTEVNHFPELRSLLERLNIDPVKKKQRQTFVFSATLTLVHDLPLHTRMKMKKKRKKNLALSPDDKLKNLIGLLGITDPKIIDVTKKTGIADLLAESSIICSLVEKDYYLYYFLQRHPGRTLVFCNSISCVRRLASLLSLLGVHPLPIHANMIQKQRLKNLERFRDSPEGLLLATDVAARGLDIPHVQHVIHYQVPRTSETYIHRSGRTARANNEGLTLLLIESAEQKQYIRLMRNLNRDKELPSFPITTSLMVSVKERVNLARDIDKMQLEYKKAMSKVSWVEKTAQEMDIIVDDDEMPEKVNDRATAVIKRQLAAKQKQLRSLLNRSLRPQATFSKYPLLNKSVNTSAGAFSPSQTALEALRSASVDQDKKRKRKPKPFRAKKKRKLSKETAEQESSDL